MLSRTTMAPVMNSKTVRANVNPAFASILAFKVSMLISTWTSLRFSVLQYWCTIVSSKWLDSRRTDNTAFQIQPEESWSFLLSFLFFWLWTLLGAWYYVGTSYDAVSHLKNETKTTLYQALIPIKMVAVAVVANAVQYVVVWIFLQKAGFWNVPSSISDPRRATQ